MINHVSCVVDNFCQSPGEEEYSELLTALGVESQNLM